MDRYVGVARNDFPELYEALCDRFQQQPLDNFIQECARRFIEAGDFYPDLAAAARTREAVHAALAAALRVP